MLYRWDEYSLDREGTLLTRQGQQVDVSRKVLDCIICLVEQRHRVVPYDELIQKLWGHDNVTNHQLTQIIAAVRRALGDDGQSQAVIRTMPGRGYRWVQPLLETAEAAAPHALDAEQPALAPAAVAPPAERRRPRMTELVLMLVLLVVVGLYQFMDNGAPAAATDAAASPPPASGVPDTIEGLRDAMRLGRHEEVRAGLSKMPPQLADTPDARMLDIELDIERGRFDEAERKLAVQLGWAESAADPIWRAELLTLLSESRADAALGASEVLPPAKAAVGLLESAGHSATAEMKARALSARGNGFLIENDLEAAIDDLVRARDLFKKSGNEWRAAKSQRYLAHVWLREGRMTDALEQIVDAAGVFERVSDPVNEIAMRNMATRIQIEQLRWNAALAGSKQSLRLSESESVSGTRRSLGALQLRGLVLTNLGRLREARYFFEEVDAIGGHESASFKAVHSLASGRLEDALAYAARGFERYGPEARLNLNLESRDGTLLLWMIAAQGLVARGERMPVPTAEQKALLEKPDTDIGRIARGRWLWSQGHLEPAEKEFRLALANMRATGRLSDILYAQEGLIELLLMHGDTAAFEQALTEMWGRDPDRFSRDYRANLLALRVALASGNEEAVRSAYRHTSALAGERALPVEVVKAYAERTSRTTQSHGAQLASVWNAN
jgi:DNA-binding winged helix-turn-helix (wHTH) protein/tetratricopeptide (TPR) repeat protein